MLTLVDRKIQGCDVIKERKRHRGVIYISPFVHLLMADSPVVWERDNARRPIMPIILILRGEREIHEGQDSSFFMLSLYLIPSGFAPHDSLQDILHHSFMQSMQDRSQPTSTTTVETLPEIKVKPECSLKDPCSVCQENLQENEIATKLPCSHIYHKSCLLPWLSTHNTCPVCRYELPLDDPAKENDRKKRMAARDEEIERKLMNTCQLSDFSQCLHTSDESKKLSPLPCGHHFHSECLTELSKKNDEFCCPVCNKPMPGSTLPPLKEPKSTTMIGKRNRREMIETCLEKPDAPKTPRRKRSAPSREDDQ